MKSASLNMELYVQNNETAQDTKEPRLIVIERSRVIFIYKELFCRRFILFSI